MKLQYINEFLALARYKNFSDAANSLYMSQSSISKNIKKIGEDLNVKLFNRTSQGISLTSYGKIYLKYALQIKDLESRCDNTIRDTQNIAPKLRIGTIPSAKEYNILNTIFDFMRYSKINCKIENNTSSQLEKKLLNNELDIAFIKNPESQKFTMFPYCQDKLVAVLPANHFLANKDQINLTDLKNEDFILEPINSRPYQLCINLCQKNGFTPNVIYADRYIENILEFVQKGIGISLLMSKLIPENFSGVKTVPITPSTYAKIEICFLNNHSKMSEKENFIKFIDEKSSKK